MHTGVSPRARHGKSPMRRCAGIALALGVLVFASDAPAAAPPRLPIVPHGSSPLRPLPYAGPLRGGSNYLWYALGPGCDREPYGIVPNYGLPEVRTVVQAQLAAMFASGQARLSLGVSFAHATATG